MTGKHVGLKVDLQVDLLFQQHQDNQEAPGVPIEMLKINLTLNNGTTKTCQALLDVCV